MGQTVSRLEKLAKTDRYLFHGSPIKLRVIEPRQAYNNFQPDGQPAVVVTPYYEIAVFRAIMLAVKAKLGRQYFSGFSADHGRLSFRANQETLATAKTGVGGFVHILDRDDFQKHNSMEHRSLQAVLPVQIIEVNADDLPPNIETV
jgi:hypothetical protein